MSDVTRAIPSLPSPSLDLINRSMRPINRFAAPNIAVKQKFVQNIYFIVFLLPFVLISYTHFLFPPQLQSILPTLSREEQQYLLFLENAHSARLHTLREFLVGLAIISISASLCARFRLNQKSPTLQYGVSLALAIVFGIGMIQLGRLHSYEAQYYALEHQKNPEVMISATTKMYETWGGPKSETLFTKLFSRSVPYESTVAIANSYKVTKVPIQPARVVYPKASPSSEFPESTPMSEIQYEPQ